MRLNVPQTAAVHPDTRRLDFVRQVAALFDNFCQSATTMKCSPEKFHFNSMPWSLKESVLERHFLTQRTFKKGSSDRKSVVSGQSVSVRVELGGRRIIKKKKMK